MTGWRGPRSGGRAEDSARHLPQIDAEVIAAAVVLEAEREVCALLLLPEGEIRIVPVADDKLRRVQQQHPDSLVGTYNFKATGEEVAADVREFWHNRRKGEK